MRYKQREYRPEMRITWQRRRRQLHALAFDSPDPSPLLSLTPQLYMPALSIVYIAVCELCFSSVTAKRRRSRSILHIQHNSAALIQASRSPKAALRELHDFWDQGRLIELNPNLLFEPEFLWLCGRLFVLCGLLNDEAVP